MGNARFVACVPRFTSITVMSQERPEEFYASLVMAASACFVMTSGSSHVRLSTCPLMSSRSHKKCPDCKALKAIEEFPRNRGSHDGRGSYCKPCHVIRGNAYKQRTHGSESMYLLSHRYGISQEQYNELLTRNQGMCSICLDRKAEHVDHDHTSGRIRRRLCFACNNALGKFHDDPIVLRQAIRYLKKVRSWRVKAPRLHPAQSILFIPPPIPDDGV